MASTSSFSAPQKAASNRDELFMQQSLLFSDTLKDLKNLRKQLYSAAEFFEVSYMKQKKKQRAVESLKDYAMKALINTVDHLGSVAFKVNSLLDEKIGEVSETELRFACLEQRVKSYQAFINQAGISQHSSMIITPKHHKRYIFPDEDIIDDFGRNYHSTSLSAEEEESLQFRSAAQSPSFYVREIYSALQSPQPSRRPGAFSFTGLSNRKAEGRATSPLHSSLMRSGSFLKRSPSSSHSRANQRYPSEPRRTVSLSTFGEKNRSRDLEQYSSKSKRMFKALLSLRKPRKEGTLYKFLDEN
ncbi:putative Protein ABIL2 [Melia azedarach]|uniref:Uncharacterized protein n=1 Tax=Melia azedarach TaxID=155640 RepID=A0ACC1XKL2_MELAZ|nr:putative Protein ABIL2 [Melia azedarach]